MLNNIVVCSMLLALPRLAKEPLSVSLLHRDFALLALLGLGTTAGIVAMTLVLWPALRRAEIRAHWRFDIRNPAVRRVGALSGWTLGYVASNQVALFTVLALATRVGRGVRLHVCVRVLPTSSRAVRGVDHDHLRSGSRQPGATGGSRSVPASGSRSAFG